jgi:hypothetical protein
MPKQNKSKKRETANIKIRVRIATRRNLKVNAAKLDMTICDYIDYLLGFDRK